MSNIGRHEAEAVADCAEAIAHVGATDNAVRLAQAAAISATAELSGASAHPPLRRHVRTSAHLIGQAGRRAGALNSMLNRMGMNYVTVAHDLDNATQPPPETDETPS